MWCGDEDAFEPVSGNGIQFPLQVETVGDSYQNNGGKRNCCPTTMRGHAA